MSSLKKKADIFHKGFNSSTCKTSLKLAASRLKLLRNKREAQVKVLKREVAQLLEAGQEDSARVKVEHVIREEKAMSAYELIELYCEIIAARLQIIESQKHCPIDLKEAVSSVIFAQARCADLPELKDVRKNLTRKYGKDFADAAAELRPDSGVSSLIVEKLSIKSPSIEAKIKALTAIATEHDIDWKPKLMEQQLQKPKEEGFLDGPSTFQPATRMTTEPAKSEFVPQAAQKHVSVLSPIQPQASSTHGDSSSSREQKLKETESVYVQSEEQHTTLHQQYWSTNFRDATAAAEAAAKSAEMANLAAKAAADLALRGNVPRPQVSVSDEYNKPPSEVSLKSQPSEPIIRKPIGSDMRTESIYKENSRIEGPQHGGVVRDGRNREPEKEYHDSSRSSRIKPLPNSSPLKDGDEPVVMSGKAGDMFHKKNSFDHVTVNPYQVKEKIERNDDDIEYDRRSDTYYRSPRSEDQQGQRAPRGKPVEETKNYKQIKNDRKKSTHLENLSEDQQEPGNTKHTPSEELANDFKPFQSEGSSRSSAASQPGMNVFNDRSNSRRATSSVANPDFVFDNARGAARIQEPFVPIASQKSEQAAVRRNSEKEEIDVQDYDEKSYSRISSRANSSSFKSAFDESSSSFQDFTHDRHRVETWEEHVATEKNTNDFLSRSNSPRSRKYVYTTDWYQYNERQDSIKHSFSSEEVVAQSYRKDEGPDVRGEDVKGKDNTFYSASGTIPFEDEVASIQSEEDPNEFISEFGADGRWQIDDRQGSSNCLHKPAFDDGGSDDGHRINLDKIPSDDETEPMRNQSGIFLSHAPPVQPVRLESEYIMKSMSMETHEKDITPVVFDNYDDYDRDSDSGDIEISTKRTSLKDRSLPTVSAKSLSSHETDREVQLREKEGKPSDMLYHDSSSRGLENRSSGRKKWDVPTRRKQSTRQYTHDETDIQDHLVEVTTERMEMASNMEDSESGMKLRLGGLRGGMRNNRNLQDPPYFTHPVGGKGLSFKETSDTNRSAENVKEPAKRKTILISEHSSRARSENVSESDESSDGGKCDNAGVSLRSKHLSEDIKVKQVGYSRPETLVTDEGSPQRLARRSQVDESEDYHTPTLLRRNRKHAKSLDENTTIVEETSATAFYETSKSERSSGSERFPSSGSKGGLRSAASSYDVPVNEEVDPQPWRSSVGGSWRTKPPATESSMSEFPGKESSDQGLLSTNKNRRGRVINSPSESEEEVDCQTERPAARGGARGSRRTSVSSKVSVKEKLPSKDNSDQNLPSRGKNEPGYGRSSFDAEMDGEGEVDNHSWLQTSKHTLSDRELSDRNLLPREINESGLRSSLLSNDADVDRMMNSWSSPPEKLTSRKTRVPAEESLGQKFPGQTDQRKAREQSEHGYGGSIPSRDPELDDEINTLPHPSVLGEGDKFSSRRTRVLADERSRKETPEQEMDQHHHRAVGRIREKEVSRRTGLTWDSKTSIQEKDLDDNDDLVVKTKPHSKLSSFSSVEKRSTPVPRSTVSGPERENARSPQHRATPRTVSIELEIKESLKASSSAAEQGSTIKVDAELAESKTTEQTSMPPTRDLKQKETQSAPLSDAGLSRTASSNGKDTSSEKKAPAHVHQKLPSDFDSFVASFRSLRANTRKK